MKFVIFAAGIILSVSACQSGNTVPASSEADTTKAKEPAAAVNDSAKTLSNFKLLLRPGTYWMPLSLVREAARTGSGTKAAQKIAQEGSVAVFSFGEQAGDSLLVSGSSNYHEGGSDLFTLYMHGGIAPNTLRMRGRPDICDLGMDVKGADTCLYVHYYNAERKLLKTDSFCQGVYTKVGLTCGSLNKALLAGNYQLSDEGGKKYTAIFTGDGKVQGMGNYSSYFINLEWASMSSMDILNLGAQTFGYKKKGDSILLYATEDGGGMIRAVSKRAKYTLVKQK